MTEAQKAAATGGLIPVEFDGDTYLVAPSEEWDISVLELVEESKVAGALKLLLGDKQWAAFRAGHGKVRDLTAMYEVLGSAVGTGNS